MALPGVDIRTIAAEVWGGAGDGSGGGAILMLNLRSKLRQPIVAGVGVVLPADMLSSHWDLANEIVGLLGIHADAKALLTDKAMIECHEVLAMLDEESQGLLEPHLKLQHASLSTIGGSFGARLAERGLCTDVIGLSGNRKDRERLGHMVQAWQIHRELAKLDEIGLSDEFAEFLEICRVHEAPRVHDAIVDAPRVHGHLSIEDAPRMDEPADESHETGFADEGGADYMDEPADESHETGFADEGGADYGDQYYDDQALGADVDYDDQDYDDEAAAAEDPVAEEEPPGEITAEATVADAPWHGGDEEEPPGSVAEAKEATVTEQVPPPGEITAGSVAPPGPMALARLRALSRLTGFLAPPRPRLGPVPKSTTRAVATIGQWLEQRRQLRLLAEYEKSRPPLPRTPSPTPAEATTDDSEKTKTTVSYWWSQAAKAKADAVRPWRAKAKEHAVRARAKAAKAKFDAVTARAKTDAVKAKAAKAKADAVRAKGPQQPQEAPPKSLLGKASEKASSGRRRGRGAMDEDEVWAEVDGGNYGFMDEAWAEVDGGNYGFLPEEPGSAAIGAVCKIGARRPLDLRRPGGGGGAGPAKAARGGGGAGPALDLRCPGGGGGAGPYVLWIPPPSSPPPPSPRHLDDRASAAYAFTASQLLSPTTNVSTLDPHSGTA